MGITRLNRMVHDVTTEQGVLTLRHQSDRGMVRTVPWRWIIGQQLVERRSSRWIDGLGKPCIQYGLNTVAQDRGVCRVTLPAIEFEC